LRKSLPAQKNCPALASQKANKGGAYIGQKTAVFHAVVWNPSQIKHYLAAESQLGAAAQPLEQLEPQLLQDDSQQRWQR
jgi:hypothetical protein